MSTLDFDQFRSAGFTCLKDLLDPREVNTFRDELSQLMSTLGAPGSAHYGERDENGDLVYLNRLDVTSDYFFDTARELRMIALAEALLGKAVVPLHVECFVKNPGTVYETPPHQDQIFYHEHFADELAVAIWIALDEVTPLSGALEYLPTRIDDKQLLRHRSSSSTSFDYELVPEEAQKLSGFVRVPVPLGGCAIHHSYVVHRAGPNLSSTPRRAVVFNYRGSPWRQNLKEAGRSLAQE